MHATEWIVIVVGVALAAWTGITWRLARRRERQAAQWEEFARSYHELDRELDIAWHRGQRR